VLLLSGAALLLRSFRNIEQQNLGIETNGVLSASVSLSRQRFDSQQKQMEFFTHAAAALRRLPGVSAVAVVDSLPLTERGRRWYSVMAVAGKPPIATGGGLVFTRSVTAGYFRALDIPILRGRGFTEADADAKDHFLILSTQLAARLFPGEDPISQRVRLDQDGPFYLVVGRRERPQQRPHLRKRTRVLPSAPQCSGRLGWSGNSARTEFASSFLDRALGKAADRRHRSHDACQYRNAERTRQHPRRPSAL
jgi:hypothetical protein